MQTLQEMTDELSSRLMVADNSTLYTAARKKKLIQDAHLWATGLFDWPPLEKARTTVTTTNYYYDYPEEFKTDSIKRIYIDGKSYDMISFNAFLKHKRDDPNSDLKYCADYGRQYFITPTPAAGLSIDVWGIIQAEQVEDEDDETLFSRYDDSGNEAIVRKALSVGVKRVDSTLSDNEEKGAIGLLTVIWGKIVARQQKDQQINIQQFVVPDYFKGGNTAPIGNFSVNQQQ